MDVTAALWLPCTAACGVPGRVAQAIANTMASASSTAPGRARRDVARRGIRTLRPRSSGCLSHASGSACRACHLGANCRSGFAGREATGHAPDPGPGSGLWLGRCGEGVFTGRYGIPVRSLAPVTRVPRRHRDRLRPRRRNRRPVGEIGCVPVRETGCGPVGEAGCALVRETGSGPVGGAGCAPVRETGCGPVGKAGCALVRETGSGPVGGAGCAPVRETCCAPGRETGWVPVRGAGCGPVA